MKKETLRSNKVLLKGNSQEQIEEVYKDYVKQVSDDMLE